MSKSDSLSAVTRPEPGPSDSGPLETGSLETGSAAPAAVATAAPAAPEPPPAAAEPVVIHPFDKRVFGIALAVLALMIALASRYGYFVDELYFFDCLRHLSASYVDQPGLAPLLMRFSVAVFGTSATAIRILPALAAAGTVVIGALTAREFGGTRRAQFVAALGVATMPELLSSAHVANTTSYDLLAWSAFAFVALKVERTGQPRWWLLAGVVLGLGLSDSRLIVSFAIVLVIGLWISGGRRLVTNRWALGGALIAALCAVPDLWWQTQHNWAGYTFTHSLNQQNGGPGHIPTWFVGQLFLVSLALVGVWIGGLRHLWRSRNPMWKALFWSYAILFVLFAVTSGGRIYYLAGAYIYLLAAGAVAIDARWSSRRRRVFYTVGGTLTTALMLIIGLPLLSVNSIGWTYGVNRNLGDTVGWPQLANSVDAAWRSLPADQRASTVIYTQNDGEAGAVNQLSAGTGLPTAVSAQNTDWFWGPGNPNATTVLAVVPGPVGGSESGFKAALQADFGDVREVGTISNPYGIHNKEYGGKIYVCTRPREPWGKLWPSLLHYA